MLDRAAGAVKGGCADMKNRQRQKAAAGFRGVSVIGSYGRTQPLLADQSGSR
jgi:hypothetical protein